MFSFNFSCDYGQFFFSCNIETVEDPVAVSVAMSPSGSDLKNDSISRPIYVHQNIHQYKKRNITACLMTPLFCKSEMCNGLGSNDIINYIEINRILGVEFFYIYNHSANYNMSRALWSYKAQGVLEIIQWPLPHVNVEYLAEQLSINECFYRNIYMSKYVIFTDLDEVIVPSAQLHSYDNELVSSYMHMMNSIENSWQTKYCAYMFQNVFFRKKKEDDNLFINNGENAMILLYNIRHLLFTERSIKIFKPYVRSKYIVNTKYGKKLTVHFMFSCLQKKHSYNIPISDALLHHYRNQKTHDDTDRLVHDTKLWTLKGNLLQEVGKQHNILNNKKVILND